MGKEVKYQVLLIRLPHRNSFQGGMRYAVCGMRYTVHGTRYTVHGTRYTVHGIRYTAYGIRFTGLRTKTEIRFIIQHICIILIWIPHSLLPSSPILLLSLTVYFSYSYLLYSAKGTSSRRRNALSMNFKEISFIGF